MELVAAASHAAGYVCAYVCVCAHRAVRLIDALWLAYAYRNLGISTGIL